MNALIAAYKPAQISSNQFLGHLKRIYGVKKAGYSGTLDPFARGSLIVGFGNYTRLFPYLAKTPKVYDATLWLGVQSLSLDTENIVSVCAVKEFQKTRIVDILESLKGEISYIPPKYSAKRISGKRAYELARSGVEVELPEVKMKIFDLELLNYVHPYVTFRIHVSEGAYVRSVGKMIADALGVDGALCSLERLREGMIEAKIGEFRQINPLDVLKYPIISDFSATVAENLWLGKKFLIQNQKPGIYIANFEDFFSIIEIREDQSVKYLLNRMSKKC